MMPRAETPRALCHPLWWSALALLVVNDHVLKAGAPAAGAITGKLSDFAGMIVAPALLSLVLGTAAHSARARRFTRRAAAFGVGAGLCAIKLSPLAAHALELALARIGLPWRVCVDAGDLSALLALPLGYWLCLPGAARAPFVLVAPRQRFAAALPSRARVVVQYLGIALGSLACLATGLSKDKKNNSSSNAPSLRNDSGATLTLVVSSTDGGGGCAIYRDDRVGLLTADAFSAAREVVLEPDAEAVLVSAGAATDCGAASIALADGQEQRVFWRNLADIAGFVPADDPQRVKRRVAVGGKDGHHTFTIGDDLQNFELGAQPPAPTCDELVTSDATDADAGSDAGTTADGGVAGAAATLEFTDLPTPQGFLQLSELRMAQDGCLEADWFMIEGDTTPKTQRLCVPDWAFPFSANDTLAITQSASSDGARSLRITRYDGSVIKTQLEIWNDASAFAGGSIKSIAPVDCVGSLAACGAYERPVDVTLSSSGKHLRSGDDHTFTISKPKTGQPKQTRVLIGSARDVAWTAPSCSGAEARLGTRANVLELREY